MQAKNIEKKNKKSIDENNINLNNQKFFLQSCHEHRHLGVGLDIYSRLFSHLYFQIM